MKPIFLILAIIIMFSSQSYADSFPVEVCFVNRIAATGCLGVIAVLINPTPYVVAVAISAFGYSIYTYKEDVYNCKEDEISGDKIRMAKEWLEKQINNITVARYNALGRVFALSNPCQSRSGFHKIHDGKVYGGIAYTNEELDKIFDYILKMGEVDIKKVTVEKVDERDLWN